MPSQLKNELAAVASVIDELLENDDYPNIVQPEYLREAVRAYPCQGGKRLRPALLIWSCGLFGGNVEQAYNAAAAVEIYHNWTLVHDDIIDNDKVRRGAPTSHCFLRDEGFSMPSLSACFKSSSGSFPFNSCKFIMLLG